jgi:Na+-driven multidrug efflux pump
MISSVTTSTVSTVTLAGSFAVIGILVLIVLLLQKELTSTATSEIAKTLSKYLNIGILPLILVFIAVVISKVVENLK